MHGVSLLPFEAINLAYKANRLCLPVISLDLYLKCVILLKNILSISRPVKSHEGIGNQMALTPIGYKALWKTCTANNPIFNGNILVVVLNGNILVVVPALNDRIYRHVELFIIYREMIHHQDSPTSEYELHHQFLLIQTPRFRKEASIRLLGLCQHRPQDSRDGSPNHK